jgi:hypothetical protein
MSRHYYSGAALDSALVVQLTATATVLQVPEDANDNYWPASFPFFLAIDPGTTSEEIVEVASKGTLSGSTRSWNVTRFAGSFAHGQLAPVRHVFTAADADDASSHANDNGSSVAAHSSLPRGQLARFTTWAARSTPTSGAETVIGYFSSSGNPGGLPVIVAGRTYRVSYRFQLGRSDSAQDLGLIRVRLGSNTLAGLALLSEYFNFPGALVSLPNAGWFDFLGGGTSAVTSTTNALPTVAAGAQGLTFTLQKNSGTGNTATMSVSNVEMSVEDKGVV